MTDKAFVIMQIGAKDSLEFKRANEIYDFILKPALEEFDIEPYRADMDPTPGSITSKFLKELVQSKVVIADLTGRNPNVFYELGVTHSFRRPVICLAESPQSLPFDTKDERIISIGQYPEAGLSYAQGETAKKSLKTALQVVLSEDYVPSNPVVEAAGSRQLDQMAAGDPVIAELSQMRETLDFLKSQTMRDISDAPFNETDVKTLRSLIDKLSRKGLLDDSDLGTLVTPKTTTTQDSWARTIAHKYPHFSRDPLEDLLGELPFDDEEPPF